MTGSGLYRLLRSMTFSARLGTGSILNGYLPCCRTIVQVTPVAIKQGLLFSELVLISGERRSGGQMP